MPVYEYQCQSCGTVTEAWQKISEAPLSVCPSCSGELKKMISCSSFHLKGSGWYVTDYAGRNASTSKSGESCSEKPAEKPSAKASEKTVSKNGTE